MMNTTLRRRGIPHRPPLSPVLLAFLSTNATQPIRASFICPPLIKAQQHPTQLSLAYVACFPAPLHQGAPVGVGI
jgi:hypothetical protein